MLLLCLLCTGCAALPAEERAFAVALGVSKDAGQWTVHARIPDYQSPGGYQTVTGDGASLTEALAALDASAPMQLHLGQLRLLVLEAELAEKEGISEVLAVLEERADLRQEAHLAVTGDGMKELMEAMKPAAGTRLSKSIDVMLDTRIGEGTALPASLADIQRMGERQSPVLLDLRLEEKKAALSGAWLADTDGIVRGSLSREETQLLSVLTGQLRSGMLTLPEGAVRLIDAQVTKELSMPTMQSASVRMILRVHGTSMNEDEVAASVARACLTLLNKLSAMGCDALGMGRQAILHAEDMAHWQEIGWPQRLRELEWSVSVGVE